MLVVGVSNNCPRMRSACAKDMFSLVVSSSCSEGRTKVYDTLGRGVRCDPIFPVHTNPKPLVIETTVAQGLQSTFEYLSCSKCDTSIFQMCEKISVHDFSEVFFCYKRPELPLINLNWWLCINSSLIHGYPKQFKQPARDNLYHHLQTKV